MGPDPLSLKSYLSLRTLRIASKDPEAILNVLKDNYDFKLKGAGPIAFNLGCTLVSYACLPSITLRGWLTVCQYVWGETQADRHFTSWKC